MFTWDTPKALLNYGKHGVQFEEATAVFSDPDALDWEDWEHSQTEPRRKRLGLSMAARILLVV